MLYFLYLHKDLSMWLIPCVLSRSIVIMEDYF